MNEPSLWNLTFGRLDRQVWWAMHRPVGWAAQYVGIYTVARIIGASAGLCSIVASSYDYSFWRVIDVSGGILVAWWVHDDAKHFESLTSNLESDSVPLELLNRARRTSRRRRFYLIGSIIQAFLATEALFVAMVLLVGLAFWVVTCIDRRPRKKVKLPSRRSRPSWAPGTS